MSRINKLIMSSGSRRKQENKKTNGEKNNDINSSSNLGAKLLNQYQKENWGVVNNLVEDSNIKTTEEIVCQKYIEKIISYDEENLVHEVSLNKSSQRDIEEQYADVTADNRDKFVPPTFEEGIVDFARPSTERVSTCSNCDGNGRNRCRRCNGGGQNSCRRCSGTGTNSDNTARCKSCGGSGTKVCKKCSGTGSNACDTCDQKGETWKVDLVRRDFTPEESVTVDASDVPDEYIINAEGEHVQTEELSLEENEIRHEVDEYNVTAHKVEYVYDGHDHELYQIERELKAESYPMTQARQMLPYALGAAGVILLLIGAWYFGVI